MYRALDLFSGGGGAGYGYKQAGFDVTGIDNRPQPNYAGDRLVIADALDYLAKHGHEYDFIHASPPCQGYSDARNLGKARNGSFPEYPLLIEPTRVLLQKLGKPYVIETVKPRPLINPIMLCGTQFGLKVYRHRYFESSLVLSQPAHYPHKDRTPSAGNGVSPKGFISMCGTGGVRGMTMPEVVKYWQYASGNFWMETREELKESIPWRYTEYIGKQLITQLSGLRIRQLSLFAVAAH